MKYLVIEIQQNQDSVGNVVWSFDSVNDAESKYHAVLSACAILAL